mmetsp:Transcript_35832/g.103052  ORF Transcript_35832/g.103052 Transcript_35832/m.103052 type:complete len:105 (-) Transcript_35832:40-354(-)
MPLFKIDIGESEWACQPHTRICLSVSHHESRGLCWPPLPRRLMCSRQKHDSTATMTRQQNLLSRASIRMTITRSSHTLRLPAMYHQLHAMACPLQIRQHQHIVM